MVFFESLEDNEVALITGTDKINLYKGYKQTFEMVGSYDDDILLEKSDKDIILVMDALPFKNFDEQYIPQNVLRELNKAYFGFSWEKRKVILTGKWGCGVFRGDPQLKFILQWIAASQCDKTMMFCPFGDFSFNTDFLRSFIGLEVKQMINAIFDYGPKYGKLFDFLSQSNPNR
jgi:poly(ADP-ribose) glycohydrolase